MVLRTRSYPYWNSDKWSNNIGIKCSGKICSNIWKTVVSHSFISIIFANFIWILLFVDVTASYGIDKNSTRVLNIPVEKSIDNFRSVCRNYSNKFNETFFNLTEAVVQEMHFDFCQEIHPIFSLKQSENGNDYLTITINMTDAKSSKLLNLSQYLSCEDVNAMHAKEEQIMESYCYLEDVLERYDVCAVKSIDELIHVNCTECKVSAFNFIDLQTFYGAS